MRYYNTLIETIGDTPLVKLNSVNKGIKGTILVKVEYFNPGNSVKDRIALKMIEDADADPIQIRIPKVHALADHVIYVGSCQITTPAAFPLWGT